ncbi:hypothetical protein [Streptomyces boncukensis]|uniref:Uncharacterized protein n=1 Tax=Streptomyces boncukensis TaxID=2711219 RepID=A0A6G4WRA2_9ACTN|nr:hypothetical protein [Streptomyces boncukensis]NGO67628.1 hypothetical protein [Streptomyces boncukensis]
MSDDTSTPSGERQSGPGTEGGQDPTSTAQPPEPSAASPSGEGQPQGEEAAAQIARLERELAAARQEFAAPVPAGPATASAARPAPPNSR